jgi:cell division initiation protein
MDVSPKTIREVEFREKIRGYNPDDVDEFLERVAAGLEILQERLRQATERAVRAEQRTTEAGEGDDVMRRTLVLAQRTADAAMQEAREQAAQLMAHAESQAQAVRAEAAEHARRTIEEATREASAQVQRLEAGREHLREEIAALQRHLDGERTRIRAALHEAIRRVDETLPTFVEPSFSVAADANGAGTPVPPPPPPHPPLYSPPVREAEAAPSTTAVSDEEFYAELRMAVGDTSPLGPRDEGSQAY